MLYFSHRWISSNFWKKKYYDYIWLMINECSLERDRLLTTGFLTFTLTFKQHFCVINDYPLRIEQIYICPNCYINIQFSKHYGKLTLKPLSLFTFLKTLKFVYFSLFLFQLLIFFGSWKYMILENSSFTWDIAF